MGEHQDEQEDSLAQRYSLDRLSCARAHVELCCFRSGMGFGVLAFLDFVHARVTARHTPRAWRCSSFPLICTVLLAARPLQSAWVGASGAGHVRVCTWTRELA